MPSDTASNYVRNGWLGERLARRRWQLAVVLFCAVLGTALWPRIALEVALFVVESLLFMAPVIALAVGLTSYLRASGADDLIAEIFVGRRWRMLVAAALIGALTPICGIGVLPLIAGLLAAGVPLSPVMAFWLASPITDPAMLALTIGALGPALALAKTVSAVAIGLLGGMATELAQQAGAFRRPLRSGRVAKPQAEKTGEGCSRSGVQWRPWRDPVRLRRLITEASQALRLMLIWLSFAFALEALLRRYLPPELIAGLVGGESGWGIALAVLIGTPIYVDGYAALPLVRGLIELGMTPGAALAFLVSGGITSAYASIAVFALVRWPVFLWYLLLAILGSLLAGYGFQTVLALLGP